MKLKHVMAALLSLGLFASAAQAEIVLRVANSGPENPENRTVCAGDVYSDYVKKATNGEVKLVFYHANKLGGEAEALEGIQLGTIDMGTLTSGPASNFLPQTMVFDIPYLIQNNAAGWEFLNSDFTRKLSDEFLKKTGVRILGIAEHGFRHFTSNKPNLENVGDMKKLKMRVMENPAHMAMTKGLGARPTPMSFSELYMALQQGVVDGMECPIANIHDNKFYEVQKSMVLDGHLYGPIIVFINEKKFQQLTPQQQDALFKGAQAFAKVHAGITAAGDDAALKDMTAKGLKIHQPNKAELDEFRKAAQPAALKLIEKRVGKDWVDMALKASDEAHKKVAGKEAEMLNQYIVDSQKMVKEARSGK